MSLIDISDLNCSTPIAADLAKATAKMTVRGKECSFPKVWSRANPPSR